MMEDDVTVTSKWQPNTKVVPIESDYDISSMSENEKLLV